MRIRTRNLDFFSILTPILVAIGCKGAVKCICSNDEKLQSRNFSLLTLLPLEADVDTPQCNFDNTFQNEIIN